MARKSFTLSMEALDKAVKRLGSRAAVARALGVSESAVGVWASGRCPAHRVEQLDALAEGRELPLQLPTPSAVSQRTGIPVRTVQSWWSGERSPRVVDLWPVLVELGLAAQAGEVLALLARRQSKQALR